jgi:hypothetical protein
VVLKLTALGTVVANYTVTVTSTGSVRHSKAFL